MSSITSSKKYIHRGKKKNPCEKGKPDRKANNKLESRIRGYFATIESPENRNRDMSGYHKPGSMQR